MAEYTKSEAQEWARETLRGQWTTLMTPFTNDGEVDEEALRGNIRRIRSLGTRGGGCTWAMGEFWSLTHDERTQVYDIVSDEASGQWPIAAHVTHTSAPEMISLARYAEGAGFDLLIVAPPYMVTKTEDQVVDWVRMLADDTSLAIMFYNSPQFGMVMSAQGLQRICAMENVVGVKEASFNQELSIETHLLVGQKAIISTPDEWILFRGKEMGFEQQVMFANTSDWRFDTPDHNHYVQFIDNAMSGDLDEEFYDDKIRPIKQVSDRWWARTVQKYSGVLPVSLCKYWGELMGLRHGPVRPPLDDMEAEERRELRQEIEAAQHPDVRGDLLRERGETE